MKKLILAAMLGVAVIGTMSPMQSNASSWQASLNPAKVWRANENGSKIASVDHEQGNAWASLDNGPDAIYAIVNNAHAESRCKSTYVENGDWEYLKNEKMVGGYSYTLCCKNSKATASWVWATGGYDWD